MRKLDTLPKIDKIQIEILRKMKPEQRLKISVDLSEISKRLLEEGIRNRHPGYTEKQIKLSLIKILLGEEIFKTIYPGTEEIKP